MTSGISRPSRKPCWSTTRGSCFFFLVLFSSAVSTFSRANVGGWRFFRISIRSRVSLEDFLALLQGVFWCPFASNSESNSTSYDPVITDIDLIHDGVFNDLVFICHDIVNFVKSFVIWTTPGPSPLVLLFEERVHDLKVVGNDKVDKAPFLDLFYHHDRRRLDIIHLRLQLLR